MEALQTEERIKNLLWTGLLPLLRIVFVCFHFGYEVVVAYETFILLSRKAGSSVSRLTRPAT
jgi:hypothetical protein